jgi:anion-transporting  ArsA/GET3 family ATPase
LPPLHELLARVDAHQNQIPDAGHTSEFTSLDESPGDLGSAYAELEPLNPKDLPTAALEIKGRIRNALREVGKLPDIDRSIEQQEQDIAELQEKIEKQKAVLQRLAETARVMQQNFR